MPISSVPTRMATLNTVLTFCQLMGFFSAK
jgi:hypothetical protein